MKKLVGEAVIKENNRASWRAPRKEKKTGRITPEKHQSPLKSSTHLAFDGTGLIITLSGGHAASHTNSSIPGLDTSPLGQIFLSLLLPNLNLLLLTTTAELFGPELVSGLELGSTMLRDVTLRHGCLG